MDVLTGGMRFVSPVVKAFGQSSGQVATGEWNDKCLTGVKRGRPVSTGGSG